jgi:hypothetical protein
VALLVPTLVKPWPQHDFRCLYRIGYELCVKICCFLIRSCLVWGGWISGMRFIWRHVPSGQVAAAVSANWQQAESEAEKRFIDNCRTEVIFEKKVGRMMCYTNDLLGNILNTRFLCMHRFLCTHNITVMILSVDFTSPCSDRCDILCDITRMRDERTTFGLQPCVLLVRPFPILSVLQV